MAWRLFCFVFNEYPWTTCVPSAGGTTRDAQLLGTLQQVDPHYGFDYAGESQMLVSVLPLPQKRGMPASIAYCRQQIAFLATMTNEDSEDEAWCVPSPPALRRHCRQGCGERCC